MCAIHVATTRRRAVERRRCVEELNSEQDDGGCHVGAQFDFTVTCASTLHTRIPPSTVHNHKHQVSRTSKQMSRRAVTVEDEWDDDSDLPLPSRPLPNTGGRGPLLEAVDSDSDEDAPELLSREGLGQAGPASPLGFGFGAGPGAGVGAGTKLDGASVVTDITPYKK